VTLGATEPGLRLGTLVYMSPEQVRGESADARSDIFALGATLYEMLSGRTAFARRTQAETVSAILSYDADPIGSSSTN
jgi:serine/threonine protein kinase